MITLSVTKLTVHSHLLTETSDRYVSNNRSVKIM